MHNARQHGPITPSARDSVAALLGVVLAACPDLGEHVNLLCMSPPAFPNCLSQGLPPASSLSSCAAGVPCRGSIARASFLPHYHIVPECLDLLGLQYVTPGRHLIFPAQHRGDEALALVSREFAQIKGALRVQHAGAVAWRAMARIDVSAGGELLRREALLL